MKTARLKLTTDRCLETLQTKAHTELTSPVLRSLSRNNQLWKVEQMNVENTEETRSEKHRRQKFDQEFVENNLK